jgi:O-acetyl-ADP-ribose deacetylase (regulator of RNase III)
MKTELSIGEKKIRLVQGDITKQDTDAIVNAANSSLMGGGGVDGAIHRAGGPSIKKECKEIVDRRGRLPAGQAVITGAGKMKARHVIHTVGPVYRGSEKDAAVLRSAYVESMKRAAENDLHTVAFPSISTGAYGYPVSEAADIALRAVAEMLGAETSVCEARFVLFDEATFAAYGEALDKLSR